MIKLCENNNETGGGERGESTEPNKREEKICTGHQTIPPLRRGMKGSVEEGKGIVKMNLVQCREERRQLGSSLWGKEWRKRKKEKRHYLREEEDDEELVMGGGVLG
jgi:hypothetical protein